MGDVEVEEILHWSKWGGLRLHNSRTCSPLNIFTCKSCELFIKCIYLQILWYELVIEYIHPNCLFHQTITSKTGGRTVQKSDAAHPNFSDENLTLIRDAIHQNEILSNRHHIVEILKWRCHWCGAMKTTREDTQLVICETLSLATSNMPSWSALDTWWKRNHFFPLPSLQVVYDAAIGLDCAPQIFDASGIFCRNF